MPVDLKISQLPSVSGASATSADLIPIIDAGANKAISLAELVNYLKEKLGTTNLSDVTQGTPVANDAFMFDGSVWHNTPIAAAVVTVDSTLILNSSSTTLQPALQELDSAITSAAGTGIPATLFDAAGDLLVASADNTAAKLTKGSNYTSLSVNGSGTVGYNDPRSFPQNVNTQTGTTYTLVLTDAGKLVTCSNAGSITLTVPPASSVAFPAGTVIDLAQYGAGQVTVVAGAGVTVQTSSTLKLRTQWSTASLVLSATGDTWFLVGDLEPLGQSLNAQVGTTYTLVLSDAWKLVTLSNGSAITLTIPANASVAYPVGTHIDLMQLGAGQVTVAITSDTLRSTPTAKLRAQYSMGSLVKIASTTWALTGDVATS